MNRTNKMMYNALGLWGCVWGCLGFYRGHKYYNKTLKEDIYWYNECKKYHTVFTLYASFPKKPQYYYLTNLGFCLAGTICYTFPISMIPTVIYELYNLEKTIRRIDTDRETNSDE